MFLHPSLSPTTTQKGSKQRRIAFRLYIISLIAKSSSTIDENLKSEPNDNLRLPSNLCIQHYALHGGTDTEQYTIMDYHQSFALVHKAISYHNLYFLGLNY